MLWYYTLYVRNIADDRSTSVELPTPGRRVPERRGIPAGRDRRPSRTTVADGARARKEDVRQMLVRSRRDSLHEAKVLLTLINAAPSRVGPIALA